MITPKLLKEWNACWDDQSIASHFRGRSGLTPREVAADDSVSLDDRLWVLCRALWYRSESAARTFAIDSAALVSHLAGRPEDCAEHSRLVEDLRRIYALPLSERSAELATRDAAWAAAWAARAAAWAAAWAARAAAWDAALRKAIDRAIVALGPDSDGWEMEAAKVLAMVGAK